MKTLGIIGGLGPESTIDYYREIIAIWRERTGDDSYPRFLVNSINLSVVVEMVSSGRLEALASMLAAEAGVLERAGADFCLIAANTPHIGFDQVKAMSAIPLVSIVQATLQEVRKLGLSRVGLIGTRYTMQAGFYQRTFENAGVSLVTPGAADQEIVHGIYMDELVLGAFTDISRKRILDVLDRMRELEHVEAVILGGTELPLLLRMDCHQGMPLLNTTRIHAAAAVERMLD